MEQWRSFLTEQELEGFMEFETVGDLRAALKDISKLKGLNIASTAVKDVAGTATNTLSGGITAILKGIWKASQKNPKLAKANPILNKLMIDPEVSKVVDDDIEMAFIKDLSKSLEGKSDNERLEDMDMTRMLSKYIMKDYDGTIVTPRKQER